jgi:hypothetical protein
MLFCSTFHSPDVGFRTFAVIFGPRSLRTRVGLMTFASPQLPDGEAYGLRIRLSGRLGDHALIIEHEVGTAPNA